MARGEITLRAQADLERLFEFRAQTDLVRALRELLSGRQALGMLAEHPLVGRLVEDGRRELVLLRGSSGYVAKYRWLARDDVVLILAMRSQREVGYLEE
jgi:plasmid stabilization system protein ParE